MTNTHKLFTLAALAALTLSACSSAPPPKVIVDSSLADAVVYPVDGMSNRYWGKPLTFGPFHTEKTRVGDTWTWSAGLFGREFGVRSDPYRFVFVSENGDRYKVECRSKTPILRRSTRHSEWTFPLGETKLSCAIQDQDGNVHSLALHGLDGDYSGETGFAQIDDFEITALHRIPTRDGGHFSLPAALGYELRQQGRAVAAVDTMGRGIVYLARGLEERDRTAAALTLTVLMFFEEA